MRLARPRTARLLLALVGVSGCAELWNFQDVSVSGGPAGTGNDSVGGTNPGGEGGTASGTGGTQGGRGGRAGEGGEPPGGSGGSEAGQGASAGASGEDGTRGGTSGRGGGAGAGAGRGGNGTGGTTQEGGSAGDDAGSGGEAATSGAAGAAPVECEANQASSPKGDRCITCTINCDEIGARGVYPVTTKQGRCVCETEPGYFYDIGASIGAYPCDADGDGWVRDSARSYIESDDVALHDNANCTLRLVDSVTLHNEAGETLPLYVTPSGGISEDSGESGGVFPLYESVRNDDDVQLAAAGVAIPSYGARTLAAAELNGFTKACVSVEADHNDNGVRDIEEWGRLPNGQVDVPRQFVGRDDFLELYTRFGYFVELDVGWFDPATEDRQRRTVTGAYHIRERSRQSSTNDDFGLLASAGDGSEYWRSCERRRDSFYSPSSPPITHDFASLDGPDLVGSPWNGMRHHSQFKCMELVLPQERDSESLHKQSVASLATPEFPWTLNRCGLVDSTPPSTDGTPNPSSPVVHCETELPENVLLGSVVWAETGFREYSDPPPPDLGGYLRGCVDRCAEAPEPECYECAPTAFGVKQVSFSAAFDFCSSGRCDGAGHCGDCVPGDRRCLGPYVQQRCDSGQNWYDEVTCPFGCDPSESVRACACYLDAPEDAGLNCDGAKYAGVLSPGTAFELTGRIAKPERSHWYRLDIPPGPRTAAGFRIELDARSGSTFRISVHRGCSEGKYACNLLNRGTGSPPDATDITQWEFNDNCGADCDDAQRSDMVPDREVPSVAYVHVYRTDNAVSCNDYVLAFRRL
jgi:hypothetical protein